MEKVKIKMKPCTEKCPEKDVTMLLRLQQNGYSEVVRYLGGGKASLPLFLSKYINIYT